MSLFVDEVTPAPDCGHLLVHVVVPDNRSIADALSSLRQDAPRLRSEVAMTISRKRAPELSFVPRRRAEVTNDRVGTRTDAGLAGGANGS